MALLGCGVSHKFGFTVVCHCSVLSGLVSGAYFAIVFFDPYVVFFV